MVRNLLIILAIVIIVALPFALRQKTEAGAWREGDPVLVIVTPHNEAIRYEYANAFSSWHQQKYGKPVKVEWRNMGGTSEIMRYLSSEMAASAKAWWTAKANAWPAGASETVTASKPPTDEALAVIYHALRQSTNDSPDACTARIDLFFGGGSFDHLDAYARGLTVEPWPAGEAMTGLLVGPDGVDLIPTSVSGETWRTSTLFANAVSTFGICYNSDRLKDLDIARPPTQWDDLADPAYFAQVGVADPTKSGSIAKAFEMIIHQKCYQSARATGFSDDDIAKFEKAIGGAKGAVPPSVPAAYNSALAAGWVEGVRLVQRIGANARYFTDSAGKVPIDVSKGDAAAGMAIDFFGRFQAQNSRGPKGEERMVFITPVGGSSVSCDPIGLLRGAPNRQIAVRFIEFTLREEGQRLWTYKPGTPGGPRKYALRRLPARRDFYPSTRPAIQAEHLRHEQYAADDLADPSIDPFQLGAQFTYYYRWTGGLFSVQRDIIRCMCIDSGDELRAAWKAINACHDERRRAAAMEVLQQMPTIELADGLDGGKPVSMTLAWSTAREFLNSRRFDKLEVTRKWTDAFRRQYDMARNACTADN